MNLTASYALQIGDLVVAKQPSNPQDYIWYIAPDDNPSRDSSLRDGVFLLKAAPGLEEGGQLDEIQLSHLYFERYVP